MSDKEDTDKVRTSQVLAGALAAVTAALLGSTMGVAGTVVGAGLASIVSTVGGALYLRSIERTRQSVRTVHAKVVGKSGGTTVLVSPEDPHEEPPGTGEEVEAVTDRPPTSRGRLRWPMIVVGSLAAFALGMLAVTGVEWLRGESLSGTGATTFGSIVAPHRDSGTQREQPADPTTTPSTTTTGTPPPSERSTPTTTGPTSTTTTSPTPESSTTTAPPTTTTTATEPPGGSVEPSN